MTDYHAGRLRMIANPVVELLECRRLMAVDLTVTAAEGFNFGSVLQNSPTVTRTFVAHNDTPADQIFFFPRQTEDDFFVGPGSLLVPAHGTAELTVQFRTEEVGSHGCTFRVMDVNDSDSTIVNLFSVSGYVIPVPVALGLIGSSATQSTGTAQLGQEIDNLGTLPSHNKPVVASFSLSPGPNDVTMTVAATNDEAEVNPGDLQMDVFADTNKDGKLNQSEIASAVATKTILSNAGTTPVELPQLSGDRGYFLRMTVVNVNPGLAGAGTDTFVDYNLNISATSLGLPGLSVKFGAVSLTDGDTSPAAADGTDFGSAAVGQPVVSRTFTVKNTGQANLTLGVVNVGGGFEVAAGLPQSLAAGASASFTVEMPTASAGDKNSTLSFTTNVAGQSPFDFKLHGVVTSSTPTPTPVPIVHLAANGNPLASGTPLDFGRSIVGRTGGARVITVRNDGQALLTLGTPQLPSGYTLTEPLVASLAPGASDDFTITADTSTAGTFAGDVTIATNDQASPLADLPLTGSVTLPPTVEVTSLAVTGLPAVVVGGQKSKGKATFVLINHSADTIQAGPAAIELFASADGIIDDSDARIGTVTKSVKLKPGQTKALTAKLQIPVPTTDGSFNLLARGTFAGVDAGVTTGAAAVRIERPRVAFPSSVGSSPTAVTLQPGKKVTLPLLLANQGNVPAKGSIAIDLLLSNDGTDDPSHATLLASLPAVKVSIKAGATKTLKLKFTVPATLPDGFSGTGLSLLARMGASKLGTVDFTGTILASIPVTLS